jgi:hypothetical protein
MLNFAAQKKTGLSILSILLPTRVYLLICPPEVSFGRRPLSNSNGHRQPEGCPWQAPCTRLCISRRRLPGAQAVDSGPIGLPPAQPVSDWPSMPSSSLTAPADLTLVLASHRAICYFAHLVGGLR